MGKNQPHADSDLQRIYALRFSANLEYRKSVWRILVGEFFQKLIPKNSAVLDLGCGWGALSRRLVEKMGCHVHAITLSQEQFNYVTALAKKLNIADRPSSRSSSSTTASFSRTFLLSLISFLFISLFSFRFIN